MLRILTPHLCVESVLELGLDRLRGLGIEALLLDVDCTLTRYRAAEVSAEIAHWIEELRAAGIVVCLVSNGRGGRISRLAEQLGVPFVAKAFKPLPRGCKAALRKLGTSRERTAMVGDQVFADVAAARLAGLFSVLVRPIHPEEEPWYTRLKRPLENVLRARFRRGGA